MRRSNQILYSIFILSTLCSCNPVVQTQISAAYKQTKTADQIEVISLNSPAPANAILLGRTTIDEGGFTTKCSYEYVVSLAKREAAEAGADVLKITAHKTPDFWSTCHRIKAEFYKINDVQNDSTTTPDMAGGNDYGVDSGTQLASPPLASANTQQKSALCRFAFSGGYSYRLAKVAEMNNEFLEEYIRKLKNGYFLSAEFGVNISDGLNLGIRVDQMRSNNSAMVTLVPDDPNEPTETGILKDDIRISFIGAQMLFRGSFRNQKGEFIMGVSLGYMGYRDDGELIGERITTTGSSLGLRLDGGVDFKIHPSVALGINLGFATGTLNKLYIESDSGSYTLEAEPGQGESLLRLDLGGGIRFMF